MTGQKYPVTMVPVGHLRVHPDNPRTISRRNFARLVASLRDDPDFLHARPLLALPDGTIIAGNQRYRAALTLGWTEVPCAFAAVDARTAMKWMLKDNGDDWGTWQEDLAGEMLSELEAAGDDLSMLGLDDRQMRRMLAGVGSGVGDFADEAFIAIPDAPIRALVKPGDVWGFEPHGRLACADPGRPAALAAVCEGRTPTVALTAPPPNRGPDFALRGRPADAVPSGVRDDWPEREYQAERRDEVRRWFALLGEGTSLFYAHEHRAGGGGTLITPREWLPAPFRLHQEVVWLRGTPLPGDRERFSPLDGRVYWLLRAERPTTRPAWQGGPASAWSTVWDLPAPHDSWHATPLPVDLYARCLLATSRPGEAVLALHAGDGGAVQAALVHGRVALGVERSPAYCDRVLAAVARATRRPPVLLGRLD